MMRKKRIGLILTTVLIFSCIFQSAPAYGAVTEFPEIVAQSAVLINADTGEILYDKYKDLQVYPASTTKVMTALLTLENMDLDDVCTVSHNAAYTEGSRIFLLEGEQLPVEQLLYAMMLPSANDAAITLAEACVGDVDSFADMMNEKAKELGAENTHFVNPNGLPDENHVTTAADMALFAKEAMKNETFRKIVSTYEYTIPSTELQPEERLIHNSNRLLYDDVHKAVIGDVTRTFKYDGILGIKTGYTNAAGSCLVAAAERDGMTLIGVVYHSVPESLYTDMIQLLDFGFDNFKMLDLGIEAGEPVGKATVKGGKQHFIDVVTDNSAVATVERMEDQKFSADISDYKFEIESDVLTAPVKKGEKVGKLIVSRDDVQVAQLDVFAAEDVEEATLLSHLLSGFVILVVVLLLLGILFIIIRRIRHRKAIKRRKMRKREE